MLERLYEYYGTEEKINLFCRINGMKMGWMDFVVENIYEEGNIVRIEMGDSYIGFEHSLFTEVPDEEGERFVHGDDYVLVLKEEEEEECF